VHVDEDDGDVLVAGLAAVRIWLVISEHRNRKERESDQPSGEGAAIPGALEHGGLDALPALRGGLGRRRAPCHGWI
jgi:hypothetical protein